MGKTALVSTAAKIGNSLRKHSPEICTALGIGGMISAAVLAVKATPKALKLLEERKKEEKVDGLTAAETVKTVWKCYIPSVLTGAFSIFLIATANSINLKRNAAITAAYSLSETAFREYKNKVVETIGERKEEAVRDSVAKDRIQRAPEQEVILTEKGNMLCYDTLSGRYFKTDIEKLKASVNELNRQMRDEMFISLNEYYYELGLSPTKIGDDLGWNIDKGYIELSFSSQLTDTQTPCLVIDYVNPPTYRYR